MNNKTKKQLQEELELLELQKRILEVKAEIIKLEDERWETVYPYEGITITFPGIADDDGTITTGTTTHNIGATYTG